MKINVNEATPIQINWMVAKADGWSEEGLEGIANGDTYPEHNFSTDWSQAGPIIEEHGIHLEWSESHEHWLAYSWDRFSNPNHHMADGDTALIAAMRCYVASKLGEEVEVPEELV